MIGETGGSQGSVQWDGRIELEAALIFSQTRGRGSLGLGFWLALRVAFSVASWQQDWRHALKRAHDCVFSSLRWLMRALNSCNFSSFLILERRADSQLLIILFRLCSISWRRFKSSSLLLLFGIITTESGLRPRVFLFPPTPTITRNSFYICTYVYRKYIYRNWN